MNISQVESRGRRQIGRGSDNVRNVRNSDAQSAGSNCCCNCPDQTQLSSEVVIGPAKPGVTQHLTPSDEGASKGGGMVAAMTEMVSALMENFGNVQQEQQPNPFAIPNGIG